MEINLKLSIDTPEKLANFSQLIAYPQFAKLLFSENKLSKVSNPISRAVNSAVSIQNEPTTENAAIYIQNEIDTKNSTLETNNPIVNFENTNKKRRKRRTKEEIARDNAILEQEKGLKKFKKSLLKQAKELNQEISDEHNDSFFTAYPNGTITESTNESILNQDTDLSVNTFLETTSDIVENSLSETLNENQSAEIGSQLLSAKYHIMLDPQIKNYFVDENRLNGRLIEVTQNTLINLAKDFDSIDEAKDFLSYRNEPEYRYAIVTDAFGKAISNNEKNDETSNIIKQPNENVIHDDEINTGQAPEIQEVKSQEVDPFAAITNFNPWENNAAEISTPKEEVEITDSSDSKENEVEDPFANSPFETTQKVANENNTEDFFAKVNSDLKFLNDF